MRAMVENKIGWAGYRQTMVDLRCVAKGSCEGFELEGKSHLNPACVSKMLIFQVASVGPQARKVVRGQLMCPCPLTHLGAPSLGFLLFGHLSFL